MLHHLANLVSYNCHPLENGNNFKLMCFQVFIYYNDFNSFIFLIYFVFSFFIRLLFFCEGVGQHSNHKENDGYERSAKCKHDYNNTFCIDYMLFSINTETL